MERLSVMTGVFRSSKCTHIHKHMYRRLVSQEDCALLINVCIEFTCMMGSICRSICNVLLSVYAANAFAGRTLEGVYHISRNSDMGT